MLPTPQAALSWTASETGRLSTELWGRTISVNQILLDLGLITRLLQAFHLSEFYKYQSREKTNKLVFDVKGNYLGVGIK